MSKFIKFISTVMLSFFVISSAIATQEKSEMLVLIDQKISALEKDSEKNSKDLVTSRNNFQSARALLDFINRADVKPSDKLDRRLVVASQAMSLRVGAGVRLDLINVEKRDVAMALLGAHSKT